MIAHPLQCPSLRICASKAILSYMNYYFIVKMLSVLAKCFLVLVASSAVQATPVPEPLAAPLAAPQISDFGYRYGRYDCPPHVPCLGRCFYVGWHNDLTPDEPFDNGDYFCGDDFN
jgi:hypothetical protein